LKACLYSCRLYIERRFRLLLLVLVVFLSIILGIRCGYNAGGSFFLAVRDAITEPVTPERLLFSLLLPFLSAFLAVIYSKAVALIPLCAFKSFCFCCCLAGVFGSFGSVTWLAAAVLLTSNGISFFLLLCYSFRHISGFRHCAVRDLLFCMCVVFGIGVLDCFYFAPFWLRL